MASPWAQSAEDIVATPFNSNNDADVTDTGEVVDQPDLPQPPTAPLQRPQLQRNQVLPDAPIPPAPLPAPPPPPPPPPPLQNPPQPTDSLSLMQLRKFVADFNKTESAAYDFVYEDCGPLDEEIDEWFVYQFWQWVRLNAVQAAYESRWELHQPDVAWNQVDENTREDFIGEILDYIRSEEQAERLEAARVLAYVVLGRWAETACTPSAQASKRSVASPEQLDAIQSGVSLVTALGGISVCWQALQDCFQYFWSDDQQLAQDGSFQDAQDELLNLMTIMYIIIQETLADPEAMQETQEHLLLLNPGLVNFMSLAACKIRWDENNILPTQQTLMLLWKAVLLQFGGLEEIDETKRAVCESDNHQKSDDIISASPLDYHIFRQELTSKYPAYIPPQPLIPLEADNSTILPPPPNHQQKPPSNGIIPVPPNTQSGGASILHQPVHIATPAPSPPPSPGIGGKGGKKQNYQTNQNFPFMYPPLDATSNCAGGKGGAGLQDILAGRKWEGSDIPASILEAGDLFSKRVRMNRATRQLWEERERFLKTERGWELGGLTGDAAGEDSDSDIDPEDLDLDLSELTVEERELIGEVRSLRNKEEEAKPRQRNEQTVHVDLGPKNDVEGKVERRLLAVESFYRELLPHLQSLVIVLLRPTFMNVGILAQQAPVQQQQQPLQQQHQGMGRGGLPGQNGAGQGPMRQPQQHDSPSVGGGSIEATDLSPEEVDATRSREIMTKAANGTLLLLLKWLKISHVLKFEYLSQLILDHNYLPLVLKLFAHQDIQQAADSRIDRIENSFFRYCNLRSEARNQNPLEDEPPVEAENQEAQEESEDDAAPPPIKMRRPLLTRTESTDERDAAAGAGEDRPPPRADVDELGYPVNPLPTEIITDFSRRNFFSLINYLRIMQKLCKRKAHRNLLLVQYQSSNILRKCFKVPQPQLRLYTLKLFKNQVPYCGRKWRQSNMRVITAVYLHVRPELRDEWLAGSDVDAEVDSALPLEQALRSLTHWFNVRMYPDKVVGDLQNAYREEQGFFTRELEKLGMNWQDVGDDGPPGYY